MLRALGLEFQSRYPNKSYLNFAEPHIAGSFCYCSFLKLAPITLNYTVSKWHFGIINRSRNRYIRERTRN